MARLATNTAEQTQIMGMDTQPRSYLTNYTENSATTASQVLQMVFGSDNDTQGMRSPINNENERVVTPVDRDQPINPAYVQPNLRRDDDLDIQPSRGPREAANVTGDIIDNYFKENLTDVLKVSGIGSNFSAYLQPTREDNVTVRPSERPDMALEWYIPDGTNRQLVIILDKTVANFNSPGGGMGAMLVLLPQLNPFYDTDQFLVDLNTGELFVRVRAQWRRSGLYCMNNPFDIEKSWESIEHNSAAMKNEMEKEGQTSVIRIHRDSQRGAQLPTIPLMGDPEIYVMYPDAMSSLTRKNYVRDRTQSALTYILEYGQTEAMLGEGIYDEEDLQQRLRAIFGRVNAIRSRIDEALENDDRHRRRRDMHVLHLPKNFPDPQSM